MKRCVIVGGADIGDYIRVQNRLRKDDFFIFCDCGLRHQAALGVQAGLIVGDFDSHPEPQTQVEKIVLPCEKDDTDTVFAVKEALRRGFTEFLLIGVFGGRLDHTLGNVSILLNLHAQGMRASAMDDFSEMEIVAQQPVYVEDVYSYFSLLNISGTARGICIKNAKYPLDNGEITCEYQYGVSNEVLPGKRAEVSVQQGKLLLIKVF